MGPLKSGGHRDTAGLRATYSSPTWCVETSYGAVVLPLSVPSQSPLPGVAVLLRTPGQWCLQGEWRAGDMSACVVQRRD